MVAILKKSDTYSKNKKTSGDITKKLLSRKYDPNRSSSFRDILPTDRHTHPQKPLFRNAGVSKRVDPSKNIGRVLCENNTFL